MQPIITKTTVALTGAMNSSITLSLCAEGSVSVIWSRVWAS